MINFYAYWASVSLNRLTKTCSCSLLLGLFEKHKIHEKLYLIFRKKSLVIKIGPILGIGIRTYNGVTLC
jgi:hypothetical protein